MKLQALNQEELSAALGVSQRAVSGWINGATPHRRNLIRLASFFDVSVETLEDENLVLADNFRSARKATTQQHPAKQLRIVDKKLSKPRTRPCLYGDGADICISYDRRFVVLCNIGRIKCKFWSWQSGLSSNHAWTIDVDGVTPYLSGFDNDRWTARKAFFESLRFILALGSKFNPVKGGCQSA